MDDPNVPLPDTTPEPGDPSLAREAGVLKVLAGVFAASVVIYAGVAWFMTGEAAGVGFAAPGLADPLPAVLAACGVAVLLVAPLLERRIRAGGAGRGMERAVAAFRTATIVGFALRESAAVIGLVLAIVTGDPLWCYGLAAVTLVAMAAAWPSGGRLERVARGAVSPS